MRILNSHLDLEAFFKRVSKQSLLMLDYDGTLAPFVKNRMQAFPYQGVKEHLRALTQMPGARIVIISGRALADLDKLLDWPHTLELWGSHGLERLLPNGKKMNMKVDSHLRAGLQKGIAACQAYAAADFCEIKPFGVALHWRGMDPMEKTKAQKSIENEWEHLQAQYEIEIHPFDGGIELRPKGRNKGHVVTEILMGTPPQTGIAYLGDDLTDEEAFAALGEQGLKVLVREQYRQTLADLYLTPPAELLTFLDQWRGSV